MSNPFRYFNSSPEVIRLVVMMYVRYRSLPRRRRSTRIEATRVHLYFGLPDLRKRSRLEIVGQWLDEAGLPAVFMV